MDFRTRFTYSPVKGLNFKKVISKTSQVFRDDCDINSIVKRYLQNNQPIPTRDVESLYGEVSVTSLLEAKELCERSSSVFNSLPADVRKSFDNDVTKMLSWLGDKSNEEVAAQLGLFSVKSKEINDFSQADVVNPQSSVDVPVAESAVIDSAPST